MEILTEEIDLNNLDRSNWETFKFDEIAQKISKTIDPNETTLEIYVGLEHIDAEDLHIRRKGSPDDVKGGKLRCYPGDVIFGKRRAYQRKAAIVDFDGICSAHAFVFRANSDVIDPKLFPFFLHSDQFMHRMVDISVGGLSPTINWGDLKHQEFLLPPLNQQAQLAKLLWSMDELIQSEKANLEKLIVVENSFRKSEIQNLDSKEFKIDDLIFPTSKIKVGKIDKSKYLTEGNYPIIDQSLKFIIGYTNDKKLTYQDELPVLVFGDHTTIIKFIDFPFVMGADGTKVIKPKSEVDVFYLYHAIKNLNIQPQGYRRHFSILKNSMIKLPKNDNWIKSFKRLMSTINMTIRENDDKIKSSQLLQKSMINQIF